MLIEVEGIDGAGKTTQCACLRSALETLGQNVLLVKEPGWGTEFGERLRGVIMTEVGRDNKAEMFSFLGCKAQLYAEVIIPSLATGKIVISDRGSGSFLSYNSIVAGVDVDDLRVLIDVATVCTRPTLTILLDLPADVAQERKRNQPLPLTRFDRMSSSFFRRQREVFKELATKLPQWVVVDGTKGIEDITAEIMNLHFPYIQRP